MARYDVGGEYLISNRPPETNPRLGVQATGMPDPGPVPTSFENIDQLIRARTPQAIDLIRGGTQDALRYATEAGQAFDPLQQFTGLEAFNEQQALLGLTGEEAQRRALAGLPVSQATQTDQRRQMETLLRRAQAGGDVSGATLLNAQQLGAEQQFGNVQSRLAALEPLAAIARTARGTLSQQAEAVRARRAALLSGQGTQLANIRFGAAAPQISSIQNRADISGLRRISDAQQQGALLQQFAGLAGRFAPSIQQAFTPAQSTAVTSTVPTRQIAPPLTAV